MTKSVLLFSASMPLRSVSNVACPVRIFVCVTISALGGRILNLSKYAFTAPLRSPSRPSVSATAMTSPCWCRTGPTGSGTRRVSDQERLAHRHTGAHGRGVEFVQRRQRRAVRIDPAVGVLEPHLDALKVLD